MSYSLSDPSDFDSNRGEPTVSSGPVTIADRPIEAGVYNWGWVQYGDYGSDGKPGEISVMLLKGEPSTQRAMVSAHRIMVRPRWKTLLLCYGPALLAFVALSSARYGEASWLANFALPLAAITGWQLWKYYRASEALTGALEVRADRSLENYIVGKAFLKALSHRDLPSGDIYSYFELRARATELLRVASDDFH